MKSIGFVIFAVLMIALYGIALWSLIAGVNRLSPRRDDALRDVQYNGFMEFLRRVQRAIVPGARPVQKP